MTRIKALRESIRKELEKACGITFYSESAPGWAKAPFGVFSLLLLRREVNWDVYDLLVNIADCGKDEDQVETLAEKAAQRLDALDYFGEDGISWTAYLNSCQPIDHADTTIFQRRLNYTIKYYRKD